MFTFLHAADIHIDSPLQKLERYEGAPVEEIRHAARRALENLVKLAIDKKVAFVLISGDLYDGDWKDYNTGLYFVSQMTKLRKADIPVYIITGNHDAANKITKNIRLPEGIHMFPAGKPGSFYLDDLDVAIHGQGFAAQAVKKDLSAGYPSPAAGCFNIGMLHTSVTGREGHEPYAPCTIEGLLSKGYDYWALGHVHKREILYEDPMIVFPGNIQGRNIRETGPKGCLLVTVDEKRGTTADFHSLDVIRWIHCEVDAAKAESGYDVVDLVCSNLEKILEQSGSLPFIARIEINGLTPVHVELSADPERWINEIRSTAIDSGGGRIWIEKVKFATKLPIKKEPAELTDGPVGEILSFLDEVRSNPEMLKTFGEPLNELMKKLPRELKDGSGPIFPGDSKWLQEILDEVQPLLLHRLMSKEETK